MGLCAGRVGGRGGEERLDDIEVVRCLGVTERLMADVIDAFRTVCGPAEGE